MRLFCCFILLSSFLRAALVPSLIPLPQKVEKISAEGFSLTESTHLIYVEEVKREAEMLAQQLRKCTGFSVPLLSEKDAQLKKLSSPPIRLTCSSSQPMSGYVLEVNGASGVSIVGGDAAGVFYATQTLLQLFPAEVVSDVSVDQRWSAPAYKITDKPHFQWRGMHLDESRHFYGKEFAKRYIDLLASYKMNVFHWHLIDDGGWRIEIKKYPRLTQLGAFRKGQAEGWRPTELAFPTTTEELESGPTYGGYYTQEEIREIVAYAKDRHVRVIPEIEMPGHSLPALDTHPHLRCGGNLKADNQTWTPSRQNSYCAGKDSSFEFLQNVLLEVFELFPDEYIHIGGDEVIKSFWLQCPDCKKRMQEEGLRSADQLQSYFIRRMETFINAHGKRLIGWDEITHGGLAPNATVMFWLGMGAVPTTAAKGHDIIMSPTAPCYFDYVYPKNGVDKVFNWELVPEQLRGTPLEKKILGGQANVWTEHMVTSEQVEFMILPRMLAMAEVLWTYSDKRDYPGFVQRLNGVYSRFDIKGLNYNLPTPQPEASAYLFEDAAQISFSTPPVGFQLRYTIDGTTPNEHSLLYSQPVKCSENTLLRAVLTHDGKVSQEVEVDCRQFSPIQGLKLEPQLHAEYVEGRFKKSPDFSLLKGVAKSLVPSPTLSIARRSDFFATRYHGFIEIQQSGTYQFSLTSDDGSLLRIAGATVVDHDTPHGYSKKSGSVKLKKGIYPIEICYFELSGGQRLSVTMTPPAGTEVSLPPALLYHATRE